MSVGESSIPLLGERLEEEGYFVVEQAVGAILLSSLRESFNERTLTEATSDNFGKSGGFIRADYQNPVLVDLLCLPATMGILADLGYTHPKLHNCYVSAKPPGTEALPWHSDLFYPYDMLKPAELFAIYYLQDTSPDNGGLRVVPGSHLWFRDKNTVEYGANFRDDEVDVNVRAGDVFVGDRRILHATHPNTSDGWRTALTIAYAPDFADLPRRIQQLIVQNPCLPPQGWWNDLDRSGLDPRLQHILPIYDEHVAGKSNATD